MRKLLFTGPKQIGFADEPDESLTPTSIRIKSLYNGISHGTEMNFYRGTAPHMSYDINDGLFTKRKESKLQYPIWHGYETVGEVIETGSEVKGFKPADIVWTGNSHADTIVCDTTIDGRPFFCERAPEGADPSAGIFLALAGVAFDGFLTSNLRFGESGAVSGLGCVGLICVQIMAKAGVHPIFAIDPIPLRREMALKMGCNHIIDPAEGETAEKIRDLNEGKGVDAAIECSGNWRALHESIRCCASGYGRTVALGFYQGSGEELRLGEEFHHSTFFSMGASSILALNNRRDPAPGRGWDRIVVYHNLAQILGDGRLTTKGLLTHTFAFEKAAEAYELVDKKPQETIKVALKF